MTNQPAPPSTEAKCPRCEGTQRIPYGPGKFQWDECDVCRTSGWVNWHPDDVGAGDVCEESPYQGLLNLYAYDVGIHERVSTGNGLCLTVVGPRCELDRAMAAARALVQSKDADAMALVFAAAVELMCESLSSWVPPREARRYQRDHDAILAALAGQEAA